jgi:hypothetical protein
MDITTTDLGIIITTIGVIITIYGIVLTRKSDLILKEVKKKTTFIYENSVDRNSFTTRSVRINKEIDKSKNVWHLTDTLSINKIYYNYYKNAPVDETRRITFLAPLRDNSPIIIGAIIRKYLAPNITIRNINETVEKKILNAFPFKFVLGDNQMILLSDEKIGDKNTSKSAVFIISDPNPLAKFVQKMLIEGNIINECETLEEWIKNHKLHINDGKTLKKILKDPASTIKMYLNKYVQDDIINYHSIDDAFDSYAKILNVSTPDKLDSIKNSVL